jgi:hypothetical protein
MKKLLLITILLTAPIWCRAYTITNINPTIDLDWTNVYPKLNANNGNFVAWLNSHDATNAWVLYQVLSQGTNQTLHQLEISTNAAAIAGLKTNLPSFYRAGITNIPTLTTSQAVLFSTPFSPTVGTNYSVSVSFDTALAAAVGFSTTAKTTNGFTVTLSGTITGAVQVDYAAWPYH